MERFAGKVAMVTGAASGIGRATALRLADEGATLLLLDVQAEALTQTAKDARQRGARGAEVTTDLCDVSDPEAARASVQKCLDACGRLDVLCNVAGISHWHHSHELPLEVWNRVLTVNLTETFLMTRAALPGLLESKGNIVNVSSTAALAGHPWLLAYSASKGAMLAMTMTLAVEYAQQGLRVNAVCPGSILTPMRDDFTLPEGANPKLLRRISSLTEPRPPEDCASVIAFLASDDAAHVNGEHVRVDGATLS